MTLVRLIMEIRPDASDAAIDHLTTQIGKTIENHDRCVDRLRGYSTPRMCPNDALTISTPDPTEAGIVVRHGWEIEGR